MEERFRVAVWATHLGTPLYDFGDVCPVLYVGNKCIQQLPPTTLWSFFLLAVINQLYTYPARVPRPNCGIQCKCVRKGMGPQFLHSFHEPHGWMHGWTEESSPKESLIPGQYATDRQTDSEETGSAVSVITVYYSTYKRYHTSPGHTNSHCR